MISGRPLLDTTEGPGDGWRATVLVGIALGASVGLGAGEGGALGVSVGLGAGEGGTVVGVADWTTGPQPANTPAIAANLINSRRVIE